VWIGPSEVPYGLFKLVLASNVLAFGHPQQLLGRANLSLLEHGEGILYQRVASPARQLEDIHVHRPQIRRYKQATHQHRQAEDGAHSEQKPTLHHVLLKCIASLPRGCQPENCFSFALKTGNLSQPPRSFSSARGLGERF
jgi:hypothetical protein